MSLMKLCDAPLSSIAVQVVAKHRTGSEITSPPHAPAVSMRPCSSPVYSSMISNEFVAYVAALAAAVAGMGTCISFLVAVRALSLHAGIAKCWKHMMQLLNCAC